MEMVSQSVGSVRHKPSILKVRKVLGQVLFYILVAGMATSFLFPWVFLISTSLKPPHQIIEFPPRLMPERFEWVNYVYAVTRIHYGRYLVNTLVISGLVLVGRVFSCTVVAYGLTHVNWPGKNVLFMIVLATMMLPGQVTMIPVYIIYTKLDWINTILPLTVPAFFGDAFFIFLLRQFFATIPEALTDAARLDGCSHVGVYWRIVMPLARPALATLIVFTFIWTYTDFQSPLIYLKDQEMWTLSLGLRGFMRRYGAGGATALGALMAAAVLYTLPMIVLFFAAQKTFIQGIVTTGLK